MAHPQAACSALAVVALSGIKCDQRCAAIEYSDRFAADLFLSNFGAAAGSGFCNVLWKREAFRAEIFALPDKMQGH